MDTSPLGVGESWVPVVGPHDTGHLLRLRVSPSETPAGWQQLEGLSRGAFQRAYFLASDLHPSRQAPRPLEAHAFALDGLGAETLHGDSLVGAVVVAFWSLWTNRAPANEVVFSLGPGQRPGRVGGLTQKTAAATAAGKRIAVAKGTKQDGHVEAADWTEVAGIAFGAGFQSSWKPPRTTEPIAKEAEASVRAFQSQSLGRAEKHALAGAFGGPWNVLAHQLWDDARALTASTDSAHKNLAARAAVCAALAWQYGGRMAPLGRPIEQELRNPAAFGALDPEVALWRDTMFVANGIKDIGSDAGGPDGLVPGLRRDAEALLGRSPGEPVLGLAWGTLGRWELHARPLTGMASAVPYLDRALAHFAVHAPHELARSRSYRAIAYRRSGQLFHALAEIQQAKMDLASYTRPGRPELAAQTEPFLLGEEARTLFASEDAGSALTVVQDALRFFPTALNKASLLRTRAWCERALGRTRDADATVAELRKTLQDRFKDQPWEPWALALLEESDTLPRRRHLGSLF